MSSLRNNKIVIAVAGAALLAVAFWFLALSPKRKEAAALESQVSAKQAELAQAREQVASYEKARVSYKASYTELAKLGKAVPADDDIRSLLVQLDAAATHRNVDFATFDLSASSATAAPGTTPTTNADGLAPPPGSVQVGTTGISAMPFKLSFDGSYFNLTGFFNRLDHFVAVHNAKVRATGRLLRVETLALAPSSAGYPHMTATVDAASYLVAPTSGTAPPAAGTTTPASTATPPAGSSTTPSTTTATISGASR